MEFVCTILFWRASACVGQTIIGLSALTEIATFAYNLLKGHMLFFFLKIGLKINEISISQKHLIKKYNN